MRKKWTKEEGSKEQGITDQFIAKVAEFDMKEADVGLSDDKMRAREGQHFGEAYHIRMEEISWR